jgi:hypothetical protein
MERTSVISRSDIESSNASFTLTGMTQFTSGQNIANPLFRTLIEEGGETFCHYIEWRGLSHETKFLALSSRHHFYYDVNDLRDVRMLINLKKLNVIKHLDSFLHIVFNALPQHSNFIGCFSDRNGLKRNGSQMIQASLLYNRFINFLDSRTDRFMSKNDVSNLLDSHGFKIVDMADINGMTYFTAHKQRNSGE